jgi:hypothetical protein
VAEDVTSTSPLATISARDPGFDIEAFLSWAADLHRVVQRSRATGADPALRDQVAPSAWTALGLDAPTGRPPPTVELAEPLVTRVSSDALDTIVVRFTATVDGGGRTEDWVFQRPSTAVTGGRRRCPECGAIDSADAEKVCRFCNTPLPADEWQVTRVSAADPAVPSEGALTAHQLGEMLAAAVAARPEARPAPTRSSGKGCARVFYLVVLLVVAAAGLALWGWLAPDAPVHATVVKMIPGAKRARIDGTIMVGDAPTPMPVSFWWPTPVQCGQLPMRTSSMTLSASDATGTMGLTFRTDLISFSSVTTPGKGVTVIVTSDPAPPAAHQVWTNGPNGGSVDFVLAPDGSGQVAFKDLPPSLTTPGSSQAPQSGSAQWTCTDL